MYNNNIFLIQNIKTNEIQSYYFAERFKNRTYQNK